MNLGWMSNLSFNIFTCKFYKTLYKLYTCFILFLGGYKICRDGESIIVGPGSGYFPYLRFDNGGARHGFVSGVYKGALVMSFLLLSL